MSTPVAETSKPTKFIDDFKAYIDDSIIATEEFVSEMKTINSLIMDENCGESIDQFSTDLIGFTEVLHEFGTTVSDTASSLYCSYFTPTYANIMHDRKLKHYATFCDFLISYSLYSTFFCILYFTYQRYATEVLNLSGLSL